jgi:hypothetical protein
MKGVLRMASKRIDSDEKIIYDSSSSRQAQDQKRYKSLGLCIKCQKPIWSGVSKSFCEKHTIWMREYQRKKNGNIRRNKVKSYL